MHSLYLLAFALSQAFTLCLSVSIMPGCVLLSCTYGQALHLS